MGFHPVFLLFLRLSRYFHSQVVQPFFALGPISKVLYRRTPEDEVFVNILVVHHLFKLPLVTWFNPNINRLVSRDVTLLHRESAKFRWRAGSEIAEDLPVPSEKMPMFCVVYGCSNRSNREKGKGFYRVPKIVTHKGEKCKKLTEQRHKKWIFNVRLRSGGAESVNARVCSDQLASQLVFCVCVYIALGCR